MKIVKRGMYHNCAAYDILNAEAVGQKCKIGLSAAAQKRGKVACVLWMRQSFGIEVPSGFGKSGTLAGGAFVDMKGEKAALVSVGQTCNIRRDQHGIAVLMKMDSAVQSGCSLTSSDVCNS